jgi:hypothetical protein
MALDFIEIIYNEQMETFHEKRNNFFAPYDTGSDFSKGFISPFISSISLYFSINKYSAYFLAAAAVGAAIYTAKALVELVSGNSTSANESFSNSSLILKTTLALAVLTFLNPILDSLSLVTRSAVTLKDAAFGKNKEGVSCKA